MSRATSRWWATWAGVTLAVAVPATAVDALLLEARRSYFTGGFLSVDHAGHAGQAAAFAAMSIVADATVAGVLVAIVLWASSRFGLRRGTAVAAAVACPAVPFVAATVVSYQLVTYAGDLFDAPLLFDLAGRSPGEVLAVGWEPILRAGALVGSAAFALAGVAVFARQIASTARIGPVAGRSVAVLCAGLIVAGTVATTAARIRSDVIDNGIRRKPSGQVIGAIVGRVTDVDGDGAGMLGRPADPSLFDARVAPYAIDVPGNGIDENGVGGDLLPGPSYAEAVPHGAWRARPDVVLIVLESFRADAVGARVGGRPVTPVLDALAARGAAVRHAYSHNGYTVQSRRHLFTGSVADLAASTLIDDFNANGYETAYFSAQDESFGGAEQGAGFERASVAYDARADRDRRSSTFATAGSLAVSHAVLNERIAAFLATRRRDAPLFLYANFHDTHFPYAHGEIVPILSTTRAGWWALDPSQDEALREMYLNTAANVDRAIGLLLDRVTASLGREPAVVVVADHGESLYEEGFLGHGYALDDAQTRIPLVVANLPATIPEPFGQSDLRHVLHAAFTAPAGRGPAGPVVRRDPSRRVFQYLGRLERAAQIAWATTEGRVVYDLRSRRARIGGGAWTPDAGLTAAERARVTGLIHAWERMVRARAEARPRAAAPTPCPPAECRDRVGS